MIRKSPFFISIFLIFVGHNCVFAMSQARSNIYKSKALGIQFHLSSDWQILPDRSKSYNTPKELIAGGGMVFVAISKKKPFEYKKLDFYLDKHYSTCKKLSKTHNSKHLKTKKAANREWLFGEFTEGDVLGHGVETVFFGCTLMEKGQGHFSKNVPLFVFGYLKSDLTPELKKAFKKEAQSILTSLSYSAR